MHTSRRRLLQAGLLSSAAVGLGSVTAPAAVARPRPLADGAGSLVDLGIAMTSINVRFSGCGSDGAGGTNLYALSDGNPVTFSVLSPDTGELLFSWQVPDPELKYGAGVADIEGATYFSARSGGSTGVYKYDHASQAVEHVLHSGSGSAVPNPMIRNMIPDGDTLYFCCYPRSEVYAYDVTTGEARAYGAASDNGGDYAWGFARIGDHLYVGTGIGTGQLVSFHIDSGERTEIPLPADTSVVAALGTAGDLLLVPLPGQVGVYDTVAGAWRDDVTGMDETAAQFANGGDPDLCYFRRDSEYFRFDATTGAATALGFADEDISTEQFRPLLAYPVEDHDVIANFRQTGELLVFDPNGDTATVHEATVAGSPVVAHAIGLGPEDDIWVGAYLSAGVIARVDTASQEITSMRGPEQSDTFVRSGPYLLVSKYPDGVVYRYDSRQPWEWGSNPDIVAELIKPDLQDRVFKMIEADDLVLIGTVPEYGHLGGALTVMDPASGDHQTYRNVVQDQSVVSLAHRDGIVYGGTTIRGGLSTEPTTTEAHLFEFNLATRKVTSTIVPVPDAETVSTLRFGHRPTELWGMTYENTLFSYDIRRSQVTDVIETDMEVTGASWGRSPTLRFRGRERAFYGVAGDTFFRFDPASKEVTVLDDNHEWKSLEITPSGEIYLIDETNVYLYTFG